MQKIIVYNVLKNIILTLFCTLNTCIWAINNKENIASLPPGKVSYMTLFKLRVYKRKVLHHNKTVATMGLN